MITGRVVLGGGFTTSYLIWGLSVKRVEGINRFPLTREGARGGVGSYGDSGWEWLVQWKGRQFNLHALRFCLGHIYIYFFFVQKSAKGAEFAHSEPVVDAHLR